MQPLQIAVWRLYVGLHARGFQGFLDAHAHCQCPLAHAVESGLVPLAPHSLHCLPEGFLTLLAAHERGGAAGGGGHYQRALAKEAADALHGGGEHALVVGNP